MVTVHGTEYLFYTVILMGAIQLLFAVLRVDKLMRIMPHPVMVGFCDGLAVVIGLSQLGLFKKMKRLGQDDYSGEASRRALSAFNVFSDGKEWISGGEAFWASLITFVCFFVSCYLPELKWKYAKTIPSSLVAIIVGITLEWALARQVTARGTSTVGDFAEIKEAWPMPVWADKKYDMPPLTKEVFAVILPKALVMALVGLIESMMTLTLVDELTQTKGSNLRECVGQGLANIVTGVFGGMGGCATIGQAIINVNSGARLRISSAVAGLTLLVTLLALYRLINLIPLAALAGVMFNVVYHTFEWNSLRVVFFSLLPQTWRSRFGEHAEYKVQRSDAFTIVLVTVVTLLTDLAVAVGAGMIWQCCWSAWSSGQDLRVEQAEDAGKKVYVVHGRYVTQRVVACVVFFCVRLFVFQLRAWWFH